MDQIYSKNYFWSKTEKSHFRVRPWSPLTTLNFSVRGRQTQRYSNVSSSSSRRDNNSKKVLRKKLKNMTFEFINTINTEINSFDRHQDI